MSKTLSVGARLVVLTVTLLAALVALVAMNLQSLGRIEASLRTVYLDRTVPAIDLATLLAALVARSHGHRRSLS